eukprot:CAMPEP_0117737978 /NCGR_PEP_ID=MMETSP0947-20121206/2848_1 /TAXON_ID=44440 /ORGANISM="Chattonella subsalsa, Strain CCMP2191" /LENGTH=69 /DNA_ID=CAMNT_0005553565 /DNA_START=38 /DNA_END=243 /DNA_ORIENTATION=-
MVGIAAVALHVTAYGTPTLRERPSMGAVLVTMTFAQHAKMSWMQDSWDQHPSSESLALWMCSGKKLARR